MSGATRKGDLVQLQGKTLEVRRGACTVFIDDRRAANVGELHRDLYGYGGAPGVFIEGMPALRAGDAAIAAEGVGTVEVGSGDVEIGDYYVPGPTTTPKIHVRIWGLPNQTMAEGTRVFVKDASGSVVHETSLDVDGCFQFVPPRWGMYEVTLEDGTRLQVR